jgi:lipopolysaccharide export system protein LptA
MIAAREYAIIAVILTMFAAPASAVEQAAGGPPNALQGFSQNRDQPVKITASNLEVRDKNKVATFSGNVQVVQGDTTMRCKTLVVFYDTEGGGSALTTAQPGPGGQSRIRRLEARGGVEVTQKDQVATGDKGDFEMASNTVTLSGNVVVKQGQNILRGERLLVNLATGVSTVEAGKSGNGRVEGLFLPSSAPGQKGAAGQKSAPEAERNTGAHDARSEQPREQPRSRSTNPSGLY